MKYLLFIAALICINSVTAQTYQVKKNTGTGSTINLANDTGETVNIYGVEHAVFTTVKGSQFIKCLSTRTGNLYPVWIGTATKETFEGEIIRKSKKGTLFILVPSEKTNNPYPVYIEKVT